MKTYLVTSGDISILLISTILFILLVIWAMFFIMKDKIDAVVVKNNNNKSEMIVDSDIAKLVLASSSLESIDNIIDAYIKRYIDIYKIMSGFENETYINSKESDDLFNYVFGSICKEMSNTMKQTISIYFDISTDEKFADWLSMRIKLHVISEMVSQNTVRTDQDTVQNN